MSQKRINAMSDSPLTQALLSKMVADPSRGMSAVNRGDNNYSPSMQTLNQISDDVANSGNDAENIFATLPDTELAMMVLISSIISPNEMRGAEFTWTSDTPELGPELTNKMLEVISSYFEDEYKLKKMVPKMLEDALFKKGSYPLVIIPENVLDDLINGNTSVSTESFKPMLHTNGFVKPLGILGNKGVKPASDTAVSLESLFDTPKTADIKYEVDELVTVSDNPVTLKIPLLIDSITSSRVRNAITSGSSIGRKGSGLESLFNTGNITKHTHSRRHYRGRDMQRIDTKDKGTRVPIGHPLVIKAPSESLIPVHVPSSPEDHLGYFALVDMYGNLINKSEDSTYYDQLSRTLKSGQKSSEASSMLSRSSMLQQSYEGTSNKRSIEELQSSYSKMLEQDLLERLRNGIYGDAVEIPHSKEFYRIMFSRTLAHQRTQILYIPAELVTYVAFDFTANGIGRSLLEKSKILAGIRSMLLYANTMAAIKNSVPRRNVTISIPEEDLEPERTVELAMGEFQRVNTLGLPIAAARPQDVIDGLRNAATTFNVVGNPNFPEIGLSVEETNSSHAGVDTELSELMKKTHLQTFGLTVDQVDSTADIEFAVTQLNSSLLYTKRIAMYQEKMSQLLKDHIVKYTTNSGNLLSTLINLIREAKKGDVSQATLVEELSAEDGLLDNLDELGNSVIEPSSPYSLAALRGTTVSAAIDEGIMSSPAATELDDEMAVIENFLEAISITLPPPDTTRLSNQLDQYNEFSTMLDAILPAYVSEEILEMTQGENGRDTAPKIMMVIKNFFQRQFLAQNNIMPELFQIVNADGEDEKLLDLLEIHQLHSEGIAGCISTLIQKLAARHDPTDGAGNDPYDSGGAADDIGEPPAGVDTDDDEFDTDVDLAELDSLDEFDAAESADETAPEADAAAPEAEETVTEVETPDPVSPEPVETPAQ